MTQAAVLRDVVAQLATLEAAGLYHNDVRAWNVLIGPDGRAALIDYGAHIPRRQQRLHVAAKYIPCRS